MQLLLQNVDKVLGISMCGNGTWIHFSQKDTKTPSSVLINMLEKLSKLNMVYVKSFKKQEALLVW